MSLVIINLSVSVDNKKVISNLSLTVYPNKIHILMGPNGAGKSSLCYTIFGHKNYQITNGSIKFLEQDLLPLKTEERARLGLFLSFQNPVSVPGVSVSNFLRIAYKACHRVDKQNELTPLQFLRFVKEKIKLLNIGESFLNRFVNDGFSGGEKKLLEILQLAVLSPKIAILDEFDSGLDVDSLKATTSLINILTKTNKELGLLIITHYPRILKFIKPDYVSVMKNGSIVKTGGKELILEIEKKGYDN